MRNILHPLSGYKYCRRILKRYFWLGLILTLFFVTVAMTFDRAFGNTPPAKPKTSLYDNYLKTKPAATTTTTTVPHVERRIQTVPQVVPSTIPAPQGAWIPQCKTWMTQAGIPTEHFSDALYIIGRESSCNPTARNPRSSAGGIAQALPWTKMGCPLEHSDAAAICQLKWMHSYVIARYSSWGNAVIHSKSRGWY